MTWQGFGPEDYIDDHAWVCAECPADSPTYVPCRKHPHADMRIATPEDRVASRQAAERVGHRFKDTVYCVRGCGRPAHHEAIAGLTSDGVEVVELHCGDEDCECRCFKDHLWMCLDGQAYGPCSSENCEGACVWEGPCRCACHKKEDEA